MFEQRRRHWWCGVGVLALGVSLAAQSKPQTYKGLDVRVTGIERATNVSLSDCPAGANIVRGVIKPGDTQEFATVKVDFAVTPAFKPGPLAKPVLHAEDGKTFNTAQSFGDIGTTQTFSCNFSFRVPKGTKVTRLALETVTIDLAGVEK